MKDSIHVYAVIRFDKYHYPGKPITDLNTDELNLTVTVKEIVPTLEMAEKEVKRLNELNSEKDCDYFWQTTRIKKRDISIISSLI